MTFTSHLKKKGNISFLAFILNYLKISLSLRDFLQASLSYF